MAFDSMTSPKKRPSKANPSTTKTVTCYLTLDLIQKLLKGQSLDEARSLRVTLPGKGEMIKYIENLDKLPNLEHLNLGHHSISKIENLNKLVNLKELNMSHNAITKIENLSVMFRLEVVDLSHNQIARIAPSLPELKRLRVLLLHHNDINILRDVTHLQGCGNLTTLALHHNPMFDLEHCRSYVVFHLPQVQMLNNEAISEDERAAAALRWNRKELDECQAQIRELNAEVHQLKTEVHDKNTAMETLERKHANLTLTHEMDKARLKELHPRLEETENVLGAKTGELIRVVDDMFTLRQEFELLKIELAFLLGYENDDESPPSGQGGVPRDVNRLRFHDPQLAALVQATVRHVQEAKEVIRNASVNHGPAPKGASPDAQQGRPGPHGATPRPSALTPSAARFSPSSLGDGEPLSFTRLDALFDASAIADDRRA